MGGRHPPGGVARLRQRGRRGHGRAGRHHPLLPAVLSLLGRHLFGARLPAFLRPRARPGAPTLWSRWAATATGHPVACGLVALALLVPLALPMLSLHLGQEDVGASPETTTSGRPSTSWRPGTGPATTAPR
jgi:uncharacterized membrane protein YdfJ with MMPL/SSD domain